MNYGKNLSHAYIISAKAEEGYRKATELAAAILCESEGKRPCAQCRHCRKSLRGIHPDVTALSRPLDDKGKMKKEIPIDLLRSTLSTSYIMPNEAEKKVYIIRDAGAIAPNSQGVLLKILEEPPYFDAFILITDNPKALLETVRSRCVNINLNGEEEGTTPEAWEKAEKYLAILAKGDSLALLRFANEQGEMSVADSTDFVKAVSILLTDMLCGRLSSAGLERKELMRLVALMKKAREYLRFNVSSKQLFGMLSVCSIELK